MRVAILVLATATMDHIGVPTPNWWVGFILFIASVVAVFQDWKEVVRDN